MITQNEALMECLSLFKRNPYMIETIEGMSVRLGRSLHDTEDLIHQLADAECLNTIEHLSGRTLYQFRTDEQTFGHRNPSEEAFRDRYEVGFGKLSARERSVLELLIQGLSNRSIAESLCISVHTVKNHVTSILTKMGLGDRHQLLAAAYQVLAEK